MLTKLSKWMIYISSYLLLYVFLIAKIIFSPIENLSLYSSIKEKITGNIHIIFFLGCLFVISVLWTKYMLSWHNNTRYYKRVEKNSTMEMIGFIIPYIISMCTIEIDKYGMLLNLLLFFVLGFAFVYSDKVFLSPVFLLFKYKLYENDLDYILTKESMEEFNLNIEEDPDGTNIRRLCSNVYLKY